jgi:hypothetical protein
LFYARGQCYDLKNIFAENIAQKFGDLDSVNSYFHRKSYRNNGFLVQGQLVTRMNVARPNVARLNVAFTISAPMLPL